MKILFLTRRFYPEIGGVEKHVYEVSRELIKRGNEVTILTEVPSATKVKSNNNYHLTDLSDIYGINSKEPVKSVQNDIFKTGKIHIVRLNFGNQDWFQKFRVWATMFTQSAAIREADVIHCHDVFFWYFPFRFLYPRKKVYTTFHGYETKFPPTIKAKLGRKISEKLSYGNICIGDFIKKWYGTKPDFVTYGGINIKEIRSSKFEIRNKFKIKNSKLKILLIGRLEEDNGVRIYLEALELLKKRGISYRLTVCGDGQFRKRLEKYGDVIGFTPDLNKYIDRADFIFASSYLSIFEALFRGKNVFSVYQNELKEDYLKLSPFKQFIMISGDSEALFDQLSSVVSIKTGSHKRVKNAQMWAKKQTWSRVTDIYLKLWKK